MSKRRPAENPFRTSRISSLKYKHDSQGFSGLLQKLERMNRRGAVLGNCGSGKSTLLLEFSKYYRSSGKRVFFILLNEENPVLVWRKVFGSKHRLDSNDVLIVDGAERLHRRDILRINKISANAFALICSSHSPTFLPCFKENKPGLDLFESLVAELLEPQFTVELRPLLEQLYVKHCANIRTAFLALYDFWAAGEIGPKNPKENN